MKDDEEIATPKQAGKMAALEDIETCQPRKQDRTKRFRASVNIFVNSSAQKKDVLKALSKIENIEEVYEVKGEFDIVSIVSAASMEEFSSVLRKKIMKINGVKSTITSIVLKTYKQHEMR